MIAPQNNSVICWIYRSPRQDQMYLYLRKQNDFDVVPKELMQHFGSPRLVMELVLHSERKLAREDVGIVMNNLSKQGYHLQMPPKIDAKLHNGD